MNGPDLQTEAASLWSLELLPRLPERLVTAGVEKLGAPAWLVELLGYAVAAGTVVAVFAGLFALLSLIERKTLARIQNRIGPNRAGWFGILQPVADGIKMLTKEDLVPDKAEKFLHLAAPILIVLPAILALGVLPLGREWVPVPLELGLLLFFAVGAMTEISVFMAGWASGSKFPMLGAMRAISQMVSYELPLILSALGVVMVSGSLDLVKIVEGQGEFHLGFIPGWNLFTPWGFAAGIIFYIAALAESNRSPFDLPEGESEIVAGHMTEYSGFKYALFFMGEYLGLFAIAGLGVTLFLGGWQPPLPGLGFVPTWIWFFGKLALVIFSFLWVRGTFPRVRIDQLMRFGWLCMVPMALLTIPAAGLWTLLNRENHGVLAWIITVPVLVVPWVILGLIFNRHLAPATRRYHFVE